MGEYSNFDKDVWGLDLGGLTERNLHVFRLLKRNWPRQKIAADMKITVNGVNKHIQRVMDITDTHTAAAALAVLMARGLV